MWNVFASLFIFFPIMLNNIDEEIFMNLILYIYIYIYIYINKRDCIVYQNFVFIYFDIIRKKILISCKISSLAISYHTKLTLILFILN